MTPSPPPPPVTTSPHTTRPEESSAEQGRHVRWPVRRFYWAVLDGSVLPSVSRDGRGRLTQRLGYLFEGMLPGVSIEQMHAVYRPLPGPGRRYLACGVPHSVLEQGVGEEVLTLTPASLPGFVNEQLDVDQPAATAGNTFRPSGRIIMLRSRPRMRFRTGKPRPSGHASPASA